MPGLNAVAFTSDPHWVQHILQADSTMLSSSLPSPLEPLLGKGSLILLQGDTHTQERRRLKPLFQGNCLHRYSDYIHQTIRIACGNLNGPFDAQAFMKQVTLDVILRAVFGLETASQRAAFHTAALDLLNAFTPLLLLVPQARRTWLGGGPWARFLRARQHWHDLLATQIIQRRDAPPGDDILSQLLLQYPTHTSLETHDLQHLQDELTTLLLAGHETTANSLAWALYYLSVQPTTQAAIRNEIQRGSDDSATWLSTVMKSERLDAFCKEVLRLRPVVPLVIRSVLQPFQLKDKTLAPGTYVGVATHNLHSDPRLYPAPYHFDPERFLQRKYKSNEYVPFGGGEKKCLGYGFALHEMKIILGYWMTGYEIRLHQPVQPTASIQGLVMGPKQKIMIEWMTLTKAPLTFERRQLINTAVAHPAE